MTTQHSPQQPSKSMADGSLPYGKPDGGDLKTITFEEVTPKKETAASAPTPAAGTTQLENNVQTSLAYRIAAGQSKKDDQLGTATNLQDRLNTYTYPFLEALGGISAEYTFQTFGDKVKDPRLIRQLHGKFDLHKNALESLNHHGAGIFVTVNVTDGKGRKKENITALRGYYVDIDVKDAKEPFSVDKLPVPPSMVVKSAGGWHIYWLFDTPVPCDEAKRSEFEQNLKRICGSLSVYGADPKCCDCSRVLRLPGFIHLKAEPVLITVEVAHGA